jgi:hypothetical protein
VFLVFFLHNTLFLSVHVAQTIHACKGHVRMCLSADLLVACTLGAAGAVSAISTSSAASVALPFGAGPLRLTFFGRPLPFPVPVEGVFATPGGAPSFFGPGCLPLFPAGFFGFKAASASVALCVTPVMFAVCDRVTRPCPPRKLSRRGTGQKDDELIDLINKFPPPWAEQHHVKANTANNETFFAISNEYLDRAMAGCWSSLCAH